MRTERQLALAAAASDRSDNHLVDGAVVAYNDWHGSTAFLLTQIKAAPVRFQQYLPRTDLSRVGCGCCAAIYLVAMRERQPSARRSGYCDIQGVGGHPPCTEIGARCRATRGGHWR